MKLSEMWGMSKMQLW